MAADKPQDLLPIALQALEKNQYRLAELMLRDLVDRGDGRLQVFINYGLSLLYQFRWWEGSQALYLAFAAQPPQERRKMLPRLTAGLQQRARVYRQQNLVGDAGDCEQLAKALDPFPQGPVQLAARWIPHMSSANQMRTLADFALWARYADYQDPHDTQDLEALFKAAMVQDNRNVVFPMLLMGLMVRVTKRPEEPAIWTSALSMGLNMDLDVGAALSLGLNDLLTTRSRGRYAESFLRYVSRTMMLSDSPYDHRSLEALHRLVQFLHPVAEDDLLEPLAHAVKLFEIYDIEGGRSQWQDFLQRIRTRDLSQEPMFALMRVVNQAVFFLPYMSASLADRLEMQERVSAEFGRRIKVLADEAGLEPLNAKARPVEGRPLRVGYLTHTVKRHSVGFILDRMLALHGADVEVYLYDTNPTGVHDDLSKSIIANAKGYRRTPASDVPTGLRAAKVIAADRIDVLVDLDGSTNPKHAFIFYYRPAPVQCTYAGSDAMGVPYADYFLVDPYVLPEDAQGAYCERIERLPRFTWVVGGYEGQVVALDREAHRRELKIPADAVAYLIAAPAKKITAELVGDVMDVLHEVPGAVLLVKGRGNRHWLERFWYEGADAHGVDRARIRFLPYAKTAEMHRAQIRVADVVLDTLPCNGGSHSFENLWHGTPVVTRPGETFFSRMTYSMLMNLGVPETVGRTRDEYKAIAVRLGHDTALREALRKRLLDAVASQSGIWDSEGLTRDLEHTLRRLADRAVSEKGASV